MPSYVVTVGLRSKTNTTRARQGPRPDVVGQGIFPTVVTDADVKRIQADVQSESTSLDKAVVSCLQKLDPTTIADWSTLLKRCQDYVALEPSFWLAKSQVDAGQQLQRDLQPWHARLVAAGCTQVPTAPTPPPAVAPGLLETMGGLGTLLALGLGLMLVSRMGRK